MTREAFIRKWLANSQKQYNEQCRLDLVYKTGIINAYVAGRIEGNKMKYGIEYFNKLEDFIDEGEEYYNKTYNNETI